jgi:hypothetical protein
MNLFLLALLLLIGVLFTNAFTFPIHLLHLPHIPLWLGWTIGLGLLSWMLGD